MEEKLQNINASDQIEPKISIDNKYLYDKKLYFNPISDYYFSQFNVDNFGNYKIEIIDENDFILETISVNIVEELSKL